MLFVRSLWYMQEFVFVSNDKPYNFLIFGQTHILKEFVYIRAVC